MRFASRGVCVIPVACGLGRVVRRSALPSMLCAIGVAWAMSGCSESSRSPLAPSAPPSPGSAPVITDVGPAAGSVAGGARVKIVGTGFMPGMAATFDGLTVTGRFDLRDASFSTFYTEAPAHAAGTVDVVVTNPDGQSHRLASGYSYVPQDSFDLNGAWSGFSSNGTDTLVEFVIHDNRLVSALCAYDVRIPFPFVNFPEVERGEFSFTTDDGATLSGRIVSASEVMGTISFPPCTTEPLPWRASRKSY